MRKISPEEKIASALKRDNRMLAVAESATGGLVSDMITDQPGSSEYFKGGVIAYSNDIKISVLGVPRDLIKKHGAVSPEVAGSMALGAKNALGADVAVSITGIAGPSGGTKLKPVGLAYISFVSKEKNGTKKVQFQGDRISIKDKFAQAVLEMLAENL